MKISHVGRMGFLMLLLICTCNAKDHVARVESRFGGVNYVCNVYEEDFVGIAKWSIDEAGPPLSAQNAVSAAKQAVIGLVDGVFNWRVESFSISRRGSIGNWIYIVQMDSLVPPTVGYGTSQSINVVVLMNGKALRPERE